MTVARSVADVLSEHVVVQVDCIDRMYCNLYVPGLQYPEGLVGYVHRQLRLPDGLDRAAGQDHRCLRRRGAPFRP